MDLIRPDRLLALASLLEIDNKETGTRTRWIPTDEQRRMCEASCANPWIFVAKPRQIYASTYFCLEDLIWTWAQDAAGRRVACAIVVDTDVKAAARLDVCEDFARQLHRLDSQAFGSVVRRHADNKAPERLIFPGGSQIVALSAGGRRAGSSLSFHRYHFTEIPYWRDASGAYGSLMPALAKSDDAQCKIETTLDVVEDPLPRNLWVLPNRYRKLFFSTEDHASYRADPSSITDEQWTWAQGEGYTDRAAAAWFLHVVDDEFGGDLAHAFRLYPQLPHHMFTYGEGRFIRCSPRVVAPVRTLDVEGVADTWKLEVYREPRDTSGQVIIGVDTAQGKERDRSAVVALDKRDFLPVASLTSDTIWGDDLARVARAAQQLYATQDRNPYPGITADPPTRYPQVVVEDNGIGGETYHALVRLGAQPVAVTTDEAMRLAALLWVKRHAEAGVLEGPAALAEEADSLYRDELGRFKGRKDWCMAAGLAGVHAERHAPYRPEPTTERRKARLDLKKRLKRENAKRRRAA